MTDSSSTVIGDPSAVAKTRCPGGCAKGTEEEGTRLRDNHFRVESIAHRLEISTMLRSTASLRRATVLRRHLCRSTAPPVYPISITVADSADAWTSAGFRVNDSDASGAGSVDFCNLRIHLTGADAQQRGIVSWTLAGLPLERSVDGIASIPPTASDSPSSPSPQPIPHPNHVVGCDHIVVRTSSLERFVEALAAAGMGQPTRITRVRGNAILGQAFYRRDVEDGGVTVEVVGPLKAEGDEAEGEGNGGDEGKEGGGASAASSDGEAPSSLWGLALVTNDIHRTHAYLPTSTKPPWSAMQPGREITTLKGRGHGVGGISPSIAFMSPHDKEAHAAWKARGYKRRFKKGD